MLGGVDMGMEGLFEDSDLISSPDKQIMKKQSSTEVFDLYSQFAINILTILIICEKFCIFTLLKMRETSSLKYIYPVYGYNIFGRQTETRLSTICLNIFLVTEVFMAQNINKTLMSLFRWVVSNSVAKLISCITETKTVFWISCMDMFN